MNIVEYIDSKVLNVVSNYKCKVTVIGCLTDHSDSLQVDFCPPQLLPAVVFGALAFGHAAVLARRFKHVTNQRTATHFIRRHLHANTHIQTHEYSMPHSAEDTKYL